MSEWYVVTSGIWRLRAHLFQGGSGFDRWVDGFGWCVSDEPPPKHVGRRLCRKVWREFNTHWE